MSLAFVDLDRFKHINDTWGHEEGDRALIAIADLMKAAFRESDILARQGDEFIILFANTSRHDAATAMETLSHNVARFNQQAANPGSWRSPGAASNTIPPAIPVSTRWWPPLTA